PIDMVGNIVISPPVIALRYRQVHLALPTRPAAEAAPETSIIRSEDLARILRIDPDIVEVAVRGVGNRAEAFPAVDAEQEGPINLENLIFVFRIDDQIGEIEGTPDHILTGV